MTDNGGPVSSHAPRAERLLSRIPAVLIEYPFEVLIAMWGILAGASGLVRLTSSSTISGLLPPWAAGMWSLSLFLSGVTIAAGLRSHRYGTSVANGLILCAIATGVYSLAIVTVGGVSGAYAGSLLAAISCLASLRAIYLRVRRSISKRIEQARYVTEAVSIEKERRRGQDQ